MKKNQRRAKQSRKRKTGAPPPQAEAPAAASAPSISRRTALLRFRNYGIAAAVVAGGGWYAATSVSEALAEEDLARIGNGVPTVVQIHDPGCPRCRALQREARAAMDSFSDQQLQYLVANIKSADGRAFAAHHNVGHVTLMIFDAKGTPKLTLEGHNTRERLQTVFARFALQRTS